ncbi:MAG: SAM-dependent methyltransferase [Blastocatellia bacterium]|nr:SAM-dependent methyltransferase [Blastocatellia bacterium]
MQITIQPIGIIRSPRRTPEDDDWGAVASEFVLDEAFDEESLAEIESFSHVEVIFHFHLVEEKKIETGARHPRNNPAWPRAGIFAQRGKNRPNRLGLSIARIVGREGRVLRLEGLDAIDGTPVIDLKPVMREFLPREAVQQPAWAGELMKEYWEKPRE